MRQRFVASLAFALMGFALTGTSGCFAFMTKDEGREMSEQIKAVRDQTSQNEIRAAELTKQMDEQVKRLRSLVDEATKVVQRNSADTGATVEKLQTDVAQLMGRIDDIQHTQDALTKQFQDYRATSDTKLETLTNNSPASKAPPMPDNADALYTDAEKYLQGQQYLDSRRLFEGFINRYPTDPRAAKAQYMIGETYTAEKRYSNAIGAYTKVVDNFPKSTVVPDAMFKNGVAFQSLKYCSDAKIYFQELIKRYPKTTWKKDALEQIKLIQRDQKNRAICAS